MIEQIQHLWALLPEALRQNQFFSGGAILAAISWAGYNARGWLMFGREKLKAQFILEIVVTNEDEVFDWFKAWIDAQPTMSRVRSVEVSLRNPEQRGFPVAIAGGSLPTKKDTRPVFIVTPGLGTHLLWFQRRLVWFTRARTEGASGGEGGYSRMRPKQTITMRFFTRDRDLIARLFNEVRDFNLPPEKDTMRVFTYSGWRNDWKCVVARDREDPRNVILPDGVLEEMERDVRTFRASKDWYEEKGIPWRRGILLEGVPGSGKTSAAVELARRTGQNIAVVSLSAAFFDDNSLMEAIGNTPPDTILLFEDIDCVFRQREAAKDNDRQATKLTFSGFLNAIDGVMSADGVLILMSTNHPDLLDPALLRPGRMDKRIKFTHANHDQARRMFGHFYPGTNGMGEEFADALSGKEISMCRIQEHLIRHRNSPSVALESAGSV